MRWIVTMKFRPVRIDEKPLMKMPSAAGITFGLATVVLYGV